LRAGSPLEVPFALRLRGINQDGGAAAGFKLPHGATRKEQRGRHWSPINVLRIDLLPNPRPGPTGYAEDRRELPHREMPGSRAQRETSPKRLGPFHLVLKS